MRGKGDRARLTERQGARAALNRPQLECTDDRPPVPTGSRIRQLEDWPEITSQHPTWWQVHRMERTPHGDRFAVLIAEVRTEDEAFRIVNSQASMCRMTKWGSKERPYFSPRPMRNRA